MTRTRLDLLVVKQRLAPSRARAQSLILSGKVMVDDAVADKAGALVDEAAALRLKEEDHPFVSRGGVKLDAALDAFHADLNARRVLDVGASTGGFTDCCLRRGASHVVAVDVGYGQMHWSLRNDPRVTLRERLNARYLRKEDVGEPVDWAVIDVSFISLEKILPAVIPLVKPGGGIVALVKPQFEAGRAEVGKGGVVKDDAVRESVVRRVCRFAEGLGLGVRGVADSVLSGPKGNREVFVHFLCPCKEGSE